MSHERRAERALRQVVAEVRAQAPPDLDWAALEARLPRAPIPAARRDGRGALLVAAAAVLALAGTAGLAWQRGAEVPPVASVKPQQPDAKRAADGDRFALGTTIAAQAEARTIEHPRIASWTLAPHSSATLLTLGDRVVLRLECGSLTARIVPSTLPETFAVEAADVRVAAHGTVFSVTLDDTGVAVSVEEGVVLVGPRSTPGAGKRLRGPSAERFTLRGAPETGRPSPAPPRAPHPHPVAAAAATSAGTPDAPSSAQEPSAEQKREALERVVSLASACFSERTSASNGVRVTAQTALSFRASPDGSVGSVRFDPPLAPNVQTCIDEGLGKLRVAASPEGLHGSRVVVFER